METVTEFDRAMMRACIKLSVRSGHEGEYPYGVIICRGKDFVCESINQVAHEHDVTRHAEVVAISNAQRLLGTVSLDECAIYVSAEPCAICSLTIREARIPRVFYALSSPHMGGVSKWPILTDMDISNAVPEVFAPPPEIIAGLLANEAEDALLKSHPFLWGIVKARRLFVVGPLTKINTGRGRKGLGQTIMTILRRVLFDRFGRGGGAAQSAAPAGFIDDARRGKDHGKNF
jgi:tRNA(adenine34) deaminase